MFMGFSPKFTKIHQLFPQKKSPQVVLGWIRGAMTAVKTGALESWAFSISTWRFPKDAQAAWRSSTGITISIIMYMCVCV